ncbi:hypothetical protein [Streptomyces sp. NPDC005828]|uniref:hypothetical protein n=1 Tax=Streptomyces sp. NPDC005828 TaxID=3157071 RepID=UPI00340B23EE
MPSQVTGHQLSARGRAYPRAPEATTGKTRSKPLAKRRVRAEHALARLKDFELLRRHRRRGDTINDTARAVAVLRDLKVDCA